MRAGCLGDLTLEACLFAGIFIENALIKIPLESLSRNVKNEQKQVAKELENVTSTLADLRQKKATAKEAKNSIADLVGRLQGLKRKLESWHEESEADLERAHVRVQHLCHRQAHAAAPSPDQDDARIDRLIAEHLARQGLLLSANMLVRQADLRMLIDTQLFEQAQPIVEAVKEGDVGPALKWCVANRARLKKNKSTLEFQLRLQALIELVRRDCLEEAVMYSRNHLGPAALEDEEQKLPLLKRYMAVLAFGKDTHVQPYKFFMQLERRADLAQRVKEEMWQTALLPPQSQLAVSVLAGLSCLKSTRCVETPDPSTRCPVCHLALSQIAALVPYVNRRNSTLRCAA